MATTSGDESLATTTSGHPDPEVTEKARRRRFSARYKLEILEKADRCRSGTGELGALLRREGLYSSHLSKWRAQRSRGELQGLAPKKRGRKESPSKAENKEAERLRRENARLVEDLEKARTIIEVQKKLSKLLGLDGTTLDDTSSA